MQRRHFGISAISAISVGSPLLLAACGDGGSEVVAAPTPQATATAALKRAASYMDEVVSFRGGYPADVPPDIAPYVKRDKPQFIITSNFIARMGRLISFVGPVA